MNSMSDTGIIEPEHTRDGSPRSIRDAAQESGDHPAIARDVLALQRALEAAEQERDGALAELSRVLAEQSAVVDRAASRQQEAEEESRHRAALLDQAHDAILITDVDGHIHYWNKGAQRLYGWSADEVAGKQLGSVLHDERHPSSTEAMRTLLRSGTWEGELAQVARSGEECVVQSSWTLLRHDDGSTRGILTINADITERKRLEAKFLRTQRLESIGMLAGGIAHDLNNMLGPILMATELLRKKPLTDDVRRSLRLIESGARRAVDVVHHVLTFARGNAGERIPLQIRHLMKEMQQIVRGSFPPSISCTVDYARDLPRVTGDATQIHQILMNLCVNARDAMPQGGELTLSAATVEIDATYASMAGAAKAGTYVRVTVRDTGSGMSPEVQAKVFEPFFTTKETGKGTGLGLPTVLSIVHSHGGFVQLESEVGIGTAFHVHLPVAESDARPADPAEGEAVPVGHGESVLFVDDELTMREVVASTLERGGYQVLTASDGIDGLATFARHMQEIRVAVVDLLMPNLDGPVMIRAIQKLKPGVGVIAISGHDEAMRTAAATLGSSVRLLGKPFTGDVLLRSVNAVLHRGEASPAH